MTTILSLCNSLKLFAKISLLSRLPSSWRNPSSPTHCHISDHPLPSPQFVTKPHTEVLPDVTVTVAETKVHYSTSTYTDVKVMTRYTTVVVPVYVTSTKTENLQLTKYVTSTSVRYKTVYQSHTQYEASTRYVPTTQYRQTQQVVRVTDAPRTEYRTLPVYVTSTVQLPDTTNTVYRTQTVPKTVRQAVTVTRPEYRTTTVTETVQDKCGYSYPEPTVQLQYGN